MSYMYFVSQSYEVKSYVRKIKVYFINRSLHFKNRFLYCIQKYNTNLVYITKQDRLNSV